MRCPSCNYDNPADALFCMKCGTKVEPRCSSCDTVNPADANFCRKCGGALGAAAGSSPGPAAAVKTPRVEVTLERPTAEGLEGERKTVTALFADIKGSTEMIAHLDPEEARAIVDPALRIMVEAVGRYDGYVVQSTGDGIFALFGAPLAHEDHPQRALYAALKMQDALREHAARLTAQGKPAVEARIGINTGEVVMRMVETGGRVEYAPVGHVINLASRLQTAAPAAGIAISEDTRRQVEGYFELRGLGPTEVRGVSEAIDLYEVVGIGALHGHFEVATRRGLTKFVGRERELQQMQRALTQAIGGHGRIVAVMAEAGTGKSRLFYEFKAMIPAECKVLEAYSVSHGKASPWLPVLELLRNYFAITDTDDPAARHDKVRAVTTGLDPALADVLPHLFGLLGIVEGADPLAQMDPRVRLQRTLDAIRRIVLRESLIQPLLVIFEDLHWIDGQTQALLDLLADSIADARVLLLVNYRTEYRHEWANKSYYSGIRLEPLVSGQAAAMLAALLGEGPELEPFKRMIAERTGGNPFFVEEIVQALFDEGALVRNGAVRVTRSLSQLRLPPTVQGILASRIDRQPVEHKLLLQTLAVIGRGSSLGLLRQVVSHADTQLERMLGDLQTGEFIYEQPTATNAEYVFKHALTQEVAYNSLLIERRKQLHERAGQALEAIFAGQMDDHLAQLAYHYSHSDNLDKAIEYLGRAGHQAMQRSAHDNAISNLTTGIDLMQRLPDSPDRIQRELALQLPVGQALQVVRGYTAEEARRAFARARELCEHLGDPPQLSHVLFGLFTVHLLRGERRDADRLAKQLLLRAEDARDSEQLLIAHQAVGATLHEFGDNLSVREHLETGISIYDRKRHSALGLDDFLIMSLSYLALTLNTLGYPHQARKRSEQAIALGRVWSSFHIDLCYAFRQLRPRRLSRNSRGSGDSGARDPAVDRTWICILVGPSDQRAW